MCCKRTFNLDKEMVNITLNEANKELETVKGKIDTINGELKYYEHERVSLNALVEYYELQEERRENPHKTFSDTYNFCFYSPLEFGGDVLDKANERLERVEKSIHYYKKNLEERLKLQESLQKDIRLLEVMAEAKFRPLHFGLLDI